MGLTGALFLLAFAAGCVLAFAKHPIYGLLTYVAVYYLNPPVRWWGASFPVLRWSILAAVITLLALLIKSNTTRSVMPLSRQGVVYGLVAFLVWISVQSAWALDPVQHTDLVILALKYLLLVGLIYRCIDTEQHLKMFLWAHVVGCVYLGWLAYSAHQGGRFEGFGSPDIDEANAGAVQIVTGVLIGSSLFLAGNLREKIGLFAGMPLTVNAIVVTISRSGFLAMGFGGVLFNLFTPSRLRVRVRVLSVLAIVLFVMLTNPVYWARIKSLEVAGEQIQGVDTGATRVHLVEAQWRMFLDHPFGCGHRCTATLSRAFLPEWELTGPEGARARSSHSTVMTMLVEHGIPGFLLYLMLVVWVVRSLWTLIRSQAKRDGFLAMLVPGIAGAMGALFVGDLFVDYLILEVRLWLIAVLMAMLGMNAAQLRAAAPAEGPAHRPALPARGSPGAV